MAAPVARTIPSMYGGEIAGFYALAAEDARKRRLLKMQQHFQAQQALQQRLFAGLSDEAQRKFQREQQEDTQSFTLGRDQAIAQQALARDAAQAKEKQEYQRFLQETIAPLELKNQEAAAKAKFDQETQQRLDTVDKAEQTLATEYAHWPDDVKEQMRYRLGALKMGIRDTGLKVHEPTAAEDYENAKVPQHMLPPGVTGVLRQPDGKWLQLKPDPAGTAAKPMTDTQVDKFREDAGKELKAMRDKEWEQQQVEIERNVRKQWAGVKHRMDRTPFKNETEKNKYVNEVIKTHQPPPPAPPTPEEVEQFLPQFAEIQKQRRDAARAAVGQGPASQPASQPVAAPMPEPQLAPPAAPPAPMPQPNIQQPAAPPAPMPDPLLGAPPGSLMRPAIPGFDKRAPEPQPQRFGDIRTIDQAQEVQKAYEAGELDPKGNLHDLRAIAQAIEVIKRETARARALEKK